MRVTLLRLVGAVGEQFSKISNDSQVRLLLERWDTTDTTHVWGKKFISVTETTKTEGNKTNKKNCKLHHFHFSVSVLIAMRARPWNSFSLSLFFPLRQKVIYTNLLLTEDIRRYMLWMRPHYRMPWFSNRLQTKTSWEVEKVLCTVFSSNYFSFYSNFTHFPQITMRCVYLFDAGLCGVFKMCVCPKCQVVCER